MDDLISREYMKSLGATCIASRSKDGNMFPIVSIDELPSVQPDVPDTNVGDLISRQDAIDAIDNLHDKPNAWLDCAVEAIMRLPSVQPRKGKWIDYSDEGYVECPFCHSATNCYGDKDELHYCFSCGAELR